MHDFLCERMHKAEFAGMQHQTVFAGQCGRVQSVAQYGVTYGLQMHAQLVAAPGQRVQGQQ